MKLKKNIKVLFIVFGILSVAFLVVYISEKQSICKEINLKFSENEKNGKFIEKSTLLNIVRNEYGDILGKKMSDINVFEIENLINALPQVKNSEVYKNAKGTLFIEVTERIPLFRLMTDKGRSIYTDYEGFLIPVSKKTPARVIVVNGNIQIPDSAEFRKLSIDSVPQLRDIYKLVNHINKDDFFKAQFQQIYIKKDKGIVLIPRIGNQTITLGGIENYESKLLRLRYFYFNIIAKEGWNKYTKIDLSFNNQIVAK